MTKILIIADLPRYDRSSAGLRFYQIVKILANNCHVDFCALDNFDPELANDPQTESYRRDMARLGVTVKMGGLESLLVNKRYETIFFELYNVVEPCLEQVLTCQPEARIFVDSVDVQFHRLFKKAALMRKASDYETAEVMKVRELKAYGEADVVIAVTDEDKEILLKENPDFCVKVIPNIHKIVPKQQGTGTRKWDLVFVGTFRHEPNVDGMVWFIDEIWPVLKSMRPHLRLAIVGSNPAEEILRMASDSVDVTGYVEDTLPYLQNSHISIAPLRFGAGMKGKIGEAMAAGLPVVTTSVGVEGMGLEHERNVMVADTAVEFVSSILALLEDDTLYGDISYNGYEFIRERYSEEAAGRRVTEIFSDVGRYPIIHRKIRGAALMRWRLRCREFLERHLLWRLRTC